MGNNMTRDTSTKPIKDKGPGNAGAGTYGLVRVDTIIEDAVEGGNPIRIRRRDGSWGYDERLLDLIMRRGIQVIDGVELVGGRHNMYGVYALPKPLLRGFEEYVLEWVREDELPREPINIEAGTRLAKYVTPDGREVYKFVDDDEERSLG